MEDDKEIVGANANGGTNVSPKKETAREILYFKRFLCEKEERRT